MPMIHIFIPIHNNSNSTNCITFRPCIFFFANKKHFSLQGNIITTFIENIVFEPKLALKYYILLLRNQQCQAPLEVSYTQQPRHRQEPCEWGQYARLAMKYATFNVSVIHCYGI